jgi:hypothetical protein
VLVERHWGLLLASLVPALVVVTRAREPIALYLAVCFAWTLVIESKAGADVNYHGELSFLMVLVVAAGLAHATHPPHGRGARRPLLQLALLAPLVLGVVVGVVRDGVGANDLCFNRIHPTPRCFSEDPPFADRAEVVARLRPLVADARSRGRELPLILDPEIGVRVGAVGVNDWYLLGLLFEEGVLDFAKLEDAVRSRRHPSIIFHVETANRWTIRLRELALRSGYSVVQGKGDGVVEFARRERPGPVRSNGGERAVRSR